jgi:hypothetical protein
MPAGNITTNRSNKTNSKRDFNKTKRLISISYCNSLSKTLCSVFQYKGIKAMKELASIIITTWFNRIKDLTKKY